MSALLFTAFVVLLWTLLWGSLSVANVLSGVAVAALVAVILPDAVLWSRRPTVRPIASARFAGRFVWDLVRANLATTRYALSPSPTSETAIIGVSLPHASDSVLTVVANVLALSPGILPIEVVSEPATIFVHVLRADDLERTRADITHLADLALRAFGSDEAIAALEATAAEAAEAAP